MFWLNFESAKSYGEALCSPVHFLTAKLFARIGRQDVLFTMRKAGRLLRSSEILFI